MNKFSTLKKILSGILLFSFFTSYSLYAANETSHMAAAKKMVEVANVDKMLHDMYEQINNVIIQDLMQRDPCLISIKQPLTEVLTKYDERILSPTVMKSEMQKLYAKEFTEDEINKIVAFHKTPAGKKALEKAPLLAAKGMEIAQKEINQAKSEGVMDQLQLEIKKLIDNIDPKTLSPECQKKFEERKAAANAAETGQASGTGQPSDAGQPSDTTSTPPEKKE